MGAALEWLGAAGCASVALAVLGNPRTDSATGKIGAHCPFHTEGTPGGAFFYDPADDCGHCFSCGQTSDLVGIWCALQGKDFEDPEGFREFRDRYAPEHAGDARPAGRPKPRPRPREFTPRNPEEPPALWSERAASFVEHARARLLETPEVLAQLAAWGLDLAAAKACMLGWNDRPKYPPVTSWGLPFRKNDKGDEAKIFLPAGLVIPYAPGGRVVKLKIRRPEADADPRYWHVRGGFPGYMVYGRPDCRAWALIETERDAAMVWWRVRGLGLGTMATGSVAARPDARAAEILRNADLILNALDYDSAGAGQVGWWEEEFPQSVRWPVPPRVGKDPGDLARAGEDVAAWVWAGVPEHVRRALSRRTAPAPAAHAPAPSAPAPEPAGVERLRGYLRRCSRVYAQANEQGTGAYGCDGCRHSPAVCEVAREVGFLLFEDQAVFDFVGSQPEGRLRG